VTGVQGEVPSDGGRDGGELRVEASKYDVGSLPPKVDAGELPWGYGENRITAIVRDPESAYVYWEITDDGIASARSRLGAAGADGWCNLRIYDTTGRDFDGTNARDYFDISVERSDREYFLMIRRPTSTMHVEVGIKSHEGYFQAIARSGRADFPRTSPSSNVSLEWMTVTSDDMPPAAAPYRSRHAGPEPGLPGRAGAGYVDVWQAGHAPSKELGEHSREHAPWSGATVHHAFERAGQTQSWRHLEEWRAEWRGGLRFTRWVGSTGEDGATAWHEGPLPMVSFDPERVAFELVGEPRSWWTDGGAFTIFGPWRVTVRAFESEPRRRILTTWMMRRVRATTPMIERWGRMLERRLVTGYEREHAMLGASERHSLLERGASEAWRLGGSERMWLGASEWWLGGASETLWVGGSQWLYAGANAWLAQGASERLGASERWRVLGGASEWMGGSGWIGASVVAAAGSGQGFVATERWGQRPGEA
jgi:hypothetical protein